MKKYLNSHVGIIIYNYSLNRIYEHYEKAENLFLTIYLNYD